MRFPLLLLLFSFIFSSCSGKEKTSGGSLTPSPPQISTTASPDTILRRAVYTKSDSIEVERLLKLNAGRDDVIFYARRFIGVPYVASTLEVGESERLVVNLRELDCTTLVETVLALTLTKRQGESTFAHFCRNLMSLRYRDGQMNGYLSRLHYFTWWKNDNLRRGLVSEVNDPRFSSLINVENHYMSAHPEKYKHLRGNAERTDSIRRLEEQNNGPDGYYLPAAATSLSQAELSCIHDGDIIAIVTRKDGLDYSHLGFAVWGKDGKLHLLNASSIHHKVVEEPKTLRQYLKEHPSTLGIRLLRLN